MATNVTGPFRWLVTPATREVTPYNGSLPGPNEDGYQYPARYGNSEMGSSTSPPFVIEYHSPLPPMEFSLDRGGSISFPTEEGPLEDFYSEVIWYRGSIPEPSPPGFWTNFRKCKEIGSGTGAGGGSSPPIGGASPESAVAVHAPYAATLGAVGAGEIKWFKVTLAAGDYRFHTTDSPDPADYDTHLALFGADGKVIAESDDVDLGNSDYRSSITKTLAGWTYYVALTGYGTAFSDGFGAVLDGNDVPAGAIFKIEAA